MFREMKKEGLKPESNKKKLTTTLMAREMIMQQ
jgi:hypothetical protein